MRLFGLAITLIGLYGVYFNWQLVLTEQRFWFKLSFFAPIAVVAGLFTAIFPHLSGAPEDGKLKAEVWVMLAVSIAAGALNWYLLANGF